MILEQIANAARLRFKTEVEDIFPGLAGRVQYDNAAFDQPKTGLWVRWSIKPGATNQTSIGATANRFRNEGEAIASVYTPIASKTVQGDGDLYGLVDFIASAFQAKTDTGVVFRTPSLEVIGRQGKWWVHLLTCPYIADEIFG